MKSKKPVVVYVSPETVAKIDKVVAANIELEKRFGTSFGPTTRTALVAQCVDWIADGADTYKERLGERLGDFAAELVKGH